MQNYEESWEALAERAAKEQDSQKLAELTHALIDALNHEVRSGEGPAAEEQNPCDKVA